MDAVDSFRQGHQAGQDMVLNLINKYGGFDAKTVAELIQLICKAKEMVNE